MATSTAQANWKGDLKSGTGSMKLGSGAWEGPFSFKTRFEGAPGANPEELIGAALAGCFSMALSAGLGAKGITPTSIDTSAKVTLDQVPGGFGITKIELTTNAKIPGISNEDFQKAAEETKKGCPVSKALTGTKIELVAKLV
jgi:osmotically inducible protein OsmC